MTIDAKRANALCIEFNPRDKIARQVQRQLALSGAVVPGIGAGLGLVLLAGFGWRLRRHVKMRRAAQGDLDAGD